MISSLTSTCRRRQALRAALVTMVALTGCQGSLRTWRRDDPSLHDLVVTPHPWDDPSAREKTSSPDPYAERSRAAKSQTGRANPYSQQAAAGQRTRHEPTDDVAPVGDEEFVFEDEDAEFKSLISEVGPADRVELVKIYKAMQAQIRAGGHEPRVSEHDTLADAYRASIDDPQPTNNATTAAQSKAAARHKRQPARETGVLRAYSDSDSQVIQASATRSIHADELETDAYSAGDLGNLPSRSREAVHMKMNDASDEETGDQPAAPLNTTPPATKKSSAAKPGSKLQEMKPPAKSRAARPTVQEPVADTGYVEQLQFQQPARGPREDAYAISSRKHSPAPATSNASSEEIDANYTDSSYVTQASAESSLNAEPSVQPATVRPSARSGSPSSLDGSTANSSTKTDQAIHEDWRELAQKTLRSLEHESVDSSDNAQLNHHMSKRILFVLLGQLEQALEPIPSLKPHEQEYFRHNLTALYNSIDPRGNPVLARRWPLVLEDQRIAMSHLGAVSNLEVKNAAFCSHVDGFGSITKFPNYQFRPNQEVLLYCEVDNFVSNKVKDGYETRLRGNYEILDAHQTRVAADIILPEETDFCMSMRRDYFFVYRIYTPTNIAPGRYQLRLTIEDMKGNKFGQTSLDMQISSQ